MPEDFPSNATIRANATGWTPELRKRFLAHLSKRGDVRAAAASCGLSRQSVYKLRWRDPSFARAWDGSLELAERQSRDLRCREALLRPTTWRDRLGEPGPAGEAAARFAMLLAQVRSGTSASGTTA